MATPFLKQPAPLKNYTDNLNNFHQVISAAGLVPPNRIIDDGKIRRFSSNGKRGDDAGWYVFHSDGIAAGAFGCWRQGLVQDWCSKSPGTMTPAEQESHRKRVEAMRLEREAETIQRRQEAAVKAQKLWDGAEPVDSEHPYLVRKNVRPHGLRHVNDSLIVPLYNGDQLVSLQFISPDGEKRFLTGGQIKGSYSPIGAMQPGQRTYMCEGWATGATIHQSTGCAVYCAMNAGNLLDVGRYIRCEFPHKELVIAGDDDRLTKGNPGRTAALLAASTLDCRVVFPPFPDDAPMELSDFNDLQNWRDMQ